MVLNEPVVKLSVTGELSVPLPSADVIPEGTVTVTFVSSKKPAAGTKTARSPWTVQLPAIFGEICGNGVLADSGAENCTQIGAAPLTPCAPGVGVIDTTWNAPVALIRAGRVRGLNGRDRRGVAPRRVKGDDRDPGHEHQRGAAGGELGCSGSAGAQRTAACGTIRIAARCRPPHDIAELHHT